MEEDGDGEKEEVNFGVENIPRNSIFKRLHDLKNMINDNKFNHFTDYLLFDKRWKSWEESVEKEKTYKLSADVNVEDVITLYSDNLVDVSRESILPSEVVIKIGGVTSNGNKILVNIWIEKVIERYKLEVVPMLKQLKL